MLIPSIDIQRGQAVQLIGGKELALEAGDPQQLLKHFSLIGEVAVIDLDAALSSGSNAPLIEELASLAPIRVGGGIHSLECAKRFLDAGAKKVIIGSKAEPDFLAPLPRERVIVALDSLNGEVCIDGWRTRSGRSVYARMAELRDFVSGFLVTFIEKEGRMLGIDLEQVKRLREAAAGAALTVAGGITTAAEIRALDEMGVDAQLGMALYTGRIKLGEAFSAVLKVNSNGLIPTLVTDETGALLGLVWSNRESIDESLSSGQAVFFSRTRGLWRKGESSGNRLELRRILVDCDRDALCFQVQKLGSAFCHRGVLSCFGEVNGISALVETLKARRKEAPNGSYTKRLYDDPELLGAKIREEAAELTCAVEKEDVIQEVADVIYFSLVKLHAAGGEFSALAKELNRRSLRITRRPGERKDLQAESNND